MAQLNYVKKSPRADELKEKNLELANAQAETKLGVMRGELLSKKLVAFVFEDATVTLRQECMRLPGLISTWLQPHGIDDQARFAIKQDVDARIRSALNECADKLESLLQGRTTIETVSPRPQADKARLKLDALNARRRARRAAAKARRAG